MLAAIIYTRDSSPQKNYIRRIDPNLYDILMWNTKRDAFESYGLSVSNIIPFHCVILYAVLEKEADVL